MVSFPARFFKIKKDAVLRAVLNLVMTALAWSLKAWWAVQRPEDPGQQGASGAETFPLSYPIIPTPLIPGQSSGERVGRIGFGPIV